MVIEFLFLPFYLYLLFSVFTFRLKKRYPDENLQKLYKKGLLLKFFGGFTFFLIYKFYYKYGDTFIYFRNGGIIADLVFYDFGAFLKFMSVSTPLSPIVDNDLYGHIVFRVGNYYTGADSWLMIRLCAIANLISFNSYLYSTFFFSAFSFFGLWKLFLVFDKRYNHLRKYLFWAIFGVPSVLFWGSGILKDTVTIACLGLVFFQLDKLFFRGKIGVRPILLLVVNSLIIITLKGYILLAFIPPLLVGIYLYYIANVKGFFTKSAIAVVLLVAFVFGGGFLLQYFAQVSQEFSLDRIADLAEGFHEYHGYLDQTGQAGSGYSLNISSYTLAGMLGVFLQAVNVTLFRPYIWEANSPVMLISSIESMIMAFFTIRVILRKKVFGFFKNMLEPFALMCMLYSIILSFAIGITAFNFGALVRFKIPLIPFFVIGLLIIQSIGKKQKTEVVETDLEAETIPEV